MDELPSHKLFGLWPVELKIIFDEINDLEKIISSTSHRPLEVMGWFVVFENIILISNKLVIIKKNHLR